MQINMHNRLISILNSFLEQTEGLYMISTSIFPRRYVQGDQALYILADEIERHRQNALVIADKFVFEQSESVIEKALGQHIHYLLEHLSGEC